MAPRSRCSASSASTRSTRKQSTGTSPSLDAAITSSVTAVYRARRISTKGSLLSRSRNGTTCCLTRHSSLAIWVRFSLCKPLTVFHPLTHSLLHCSRYPTAATRSRESPLDRLRHRYRRRQLLFPPAGRGPASKNQIRHRSRQAADLPVHRHHP